MFVVWLKCSVSTDSINCKKILISSSSLQDCDIVSENTEKCFKGAFKSYGKYLMYLEMLQMQEIKSF